MSTGESSTSGPPLRFQPGPQRSQAEAVKTTRSEPSWWHSEIPAAEFTERYTQLRSEFKWWYCYYAHSTEPKLRRVIETTEKLLKFPPEAHGPFQRNETCPICPWADNDVMFDMLPNDETIRKEIQQWWIDVRKNPSNVNLSGPALNALLKAQERLQTRRSKAKAVVGCLDSIINIINSAGKECGQAYQISKPLDLKRIEALLDQVVSAMKDADDHFASRADIFRIGWIQGKVTMRPGILKICLSQEDVDRMKLISESFRTRYVPWTGPVKPEGPDEITQTFNPERLTLEFDS